MMIRWLNLKSSYLKEIIAVLYLDEMNMQSNTAFLI